jgi:hypothetical protein
MQQFPSSNNSKYTCAQTITYIRNKDKPHYRSRYAFAGTEMQTRKTHRGYQQFR